MVAYSTELSLQADIIFVIEATAVNGAYIHDLKTNYILPTLEFFSLGNIDDNNYVSENANSLYGVVLYHAADCLPHLSSDSIGPFASPGKVLGALDKLELHGGKGESHANVAEGLATALQCFEELQSKRQNCTNTQKHCILICNSPPYSLPVLECHNWLGKTAEQLAVDLLEANINLSIISPRKIPSLYKLFEKAGGDLSTSQTKNYAKDPRHLVLLKGFSLKERPLSPPPGTGQNMSTSNIPMTSMPSPLAGSDSPIPVQNQNTNGLLGANNAGVVGVQQVGQNSVYRPPSAGLNQIPQHSQSMVTQGMVGLANTRGAMMQNPQMPQMQPNMQGNMQINAPPGYHPTAGMGAQRPAARWGMMPPQGAQQRPPYMQANQPSNVNQGSALIAQLTTPPSSTGVNQFVQMNTNSPINQQQPQMKMNMSNVQSSMQQNAPNMQPTSAQVVTSQANMNVATPQQPGGTRERHTIWQGLLEWIEKPKNAGDQQKITKHVPCQVSANSKDNEPELKADGWPPKLIMQLMPKQLIGTIGGVYLRNSKSVLFHPQPCEALESLTRVMCSGFAGCVHFTSIPNPTPCDIKVLILLYTNEKRAYLGFIPNDQAAFVDRLRKVIQQQKTNQQSIRQTQGGAGPPMNPTAGPLTIGGTQPQMGSNLPNSQPTQQGLMMSQTNTMAMGGGQLTQNVVSSTGQQGTPLGGVLNQNVAGAGVPPRLRMPGLQSGMGPQNTQPGGSGMAPGMIGTQVQRGSCENQLQAERQHNLEKINQLKQTLEAAQQQEQQYKSQLERISHMKTTQLQEALQVAQQQELQYKLLDQQRLAQGNPQANQQQQNQQRMMRPVISNNPGLRQLLQHQPQYRQQLINMQQMRASGPNPQMQQQLQNPGAHPSTFDDVPNFDFM